MIHDNPANIGAMTAFDFSVIPSDTSEIQRISTRITRLIVGGWAGRSEAANRHHIEELQAIGVAPPRKTPMFYRLGSGLVTSAPAIQVVGDGSSGEAEAFVFRHAGELLVGVGSDHTDRVVETYGVTVSKQICPKPVGPNFWRFADVADHWDALILRSWSGDGAGLSLYQEGPVSGLLDPRDLIAKFEAEGETFADGTGMFCGTMPLIGPLRKESRFRVELEDPVLGRRLTHGYSVAILPIVD